VGKAAKDYATPGNTIRVSAWQDKDRTLCLVAQAVDPGVSVPGGSTEELTISVYPERAIRAAYEAGTPTPTFQLSPVASWRFTTQIAGTKRKWWIGLPGKEWDGWLAATEPGQTGNVLASPFSTLALKRLAERVAPQAASAASTPIPVIPASASR
jgi:hypothetical protein